MTNPEMKVIPPTDPTTRFPDVAVIPHGQKSVIVLPKDPETEPPKGPEVEIPGQSEEI